MKEHMYIYARLYLSYKHNVSRALQVHISKETILADSQRQLRINIWRQRWDTQHLSTFTKTPERLPCLLWQDLLSCKHSKTLPSKSISLTSPYQYKCHQLWFIWSTLWSGANMWKVITALWGSLGGGATTNHPGASGSHSPGRNMGREHKFSSGLKEK